MNTDTSHYAVQVTVDDDFAALMETGHLVYRVALLEDDGSELFATHCGAELLAETVRDLFEQAANVEAEVIAADEPCARQRMGLVCNSTDHATDHVYGGRFALDEPPAPCVCGSLDHSTEDHPTVDAETWTAVATGNGVVVVGPTVEPDGGTDGTAGMHGSQPDYVDPAVEQMDAQLASMTPEERASYDAYCESMENPTAYCPCHGDDQRLVGGSSTGGPDPYGIDHLACGCRVVGFSGDKRDQHCIEHDRAGDSPTPTLLVKAEDLSVGDTMVMPFDKRWTISEVKPFGPRSVYVRVRTEAGWTRLERHGEVHVLAQVPDESAGSAK